MADEFHTGLCSTMSWWNTMRTPTSFDLPLPLPSPISCTTDHQSFSWSTQPFLPAVELNEIQTGFGDSSMSDQTLLAGLFEPEVDMISDDPAVMQPASWPKFSTSNSTTHHHQLSRVSSPSKQQLSFSDNAPVWNPSPKIPEPRFEDESSGTSNLTSMKISETKRHGSTDQPAAKKGRIAMPSPLPTFKVRKEKLGDRITALQQLVSPFGKTDTASVLHEAIEYIKFLHGQVGALSTPYMKNGHQMQHHKRMESTKDEEVQDLRGRGLCLVPISSTFAVASETPMEFWAPTFLGSYR